MSDTLRLLLLNGGFVLVGVVAVALAGIPLRRGWVLTVVGLAPAAGLAACGLVATLGAMVGLDVRVLTTGLLAVLALGVAGAVLARRPPTLGRLVAPRDALVVRLLEAGGLVLLAALSVGIVRTTAATGLTTWDGWALWAPKAHALFVEGDVWGPVFRSSEYFMQHQEYPVLFPALEALSSDALGRYDPTLLDIESAALLLSFGWGAWAILRVVVTPPLAVAAAFALTGSARLITNVGANYADTAVASFTALGVLALLVWLVRDATAMLVLAGLFLTAGAMTKSEGLLFAVAAIVAALAVARGFGRSLRTAVTFGGAVLVVPALWAVVDRLNGPGAKNVDASTLLHPGGTAEAADRIPAATTRLLDEILDGWGLAALVVLGAVAAACSARQWFPALFVALWGALAFLALVTVYFLGTAPIDWHLATSADRVVFSVVLATATSAPVLVGLAWEQVLAERARIAR